MYLLQFVRWYYSLTTVRIHKSSLSLFLLYRQPVFTEFLSEATAQR
jgi:hypothetical protein